MADPTLTDPGMSVPQLDPVSYALDGSIPTSTDSGAGTASPQFSMPNFSLPDISLPNVLATGAPLVGAGINSSAVDSALGTMQGGLTNAQNTIRNYTQPYVSTGAQANQQIFQGAQTGGQFNTPFTMEMAQNMPAYQFALQGGVDAIQNSAAAKGGLLGTNTVKGLTDYGQKAAAQFQQQAFDQKMAQDKLALGALEGLSSTGGTLAGSAGTNIANLQAQGAQAGMDAAMAKAGYLTGGINNAIAGYNATKSPTGTTAGGTSPTGSLKLPTGGTTTAPKPGTTGGATGGTQTAGGVPNTYTPPGSTNSNYQYTQNPDGTFTTKGADGTTYTLDAQGNITSAMDANGNILDVAGLGGNGTADQQTAYDPSTGLAVDPSTGLPFQDVTAFDNWWNSLLAGDPTMGGTTDAWGQVIDPSWELAPTDMTQFDPMAGLDPSVWNTPDYQFMDAGTPTDSFNLDPYAMDPYSMDSYVA